MVPRIADRYRDMAERLHNLQSIVTAPWNEIAKGSWPQQILLWTAPVGAAVKELRDAAHKIGNLHGVNAALTLAQDRLKVQEDAWDLVCARYLHHEFFEFMPSFTPIIDTNHPHSSARRGTGNKKPSGLYTLVGDDRGI
jgi:hypothetical protein